MVILLENPASGSGNVKVLTDGIRARVAPVLALAQALGWSEKWKLRTLSTDEKGGWKKQLGKLLSPEVKGIFVVGGDGTLRECAETVLSQNSSVPLIPIPSGRGNDFIRGQSGYNGFERDGFFWDWADREIKTGAQWNQRATDLIKFRDRLCLNMASIGYGGEIVRNVKKRAALWTQSSAAYQIEGGIALLTTKANKAEIVVDGVNDSFALFGGFISNGQCNGSGLYWTPKADISDGKLDVIVFEKPSILGMWNSLNAVKRQEEPSDFKYRRIQSEKAEFWFERPCALELDGDYAGEFREMEFWVLPQAIKTVFLKITI